MKRIVTLIILLLIVGASASAVLAQNRRKVDVKEVTFVTSIECKNCVKKVEAKLPFAKGVMDMKITLADKSVWIKYDASKTDKDKLAAAIVKLGFTAQEKK